MTMAILTTPLVTIKTTCTNSTIEDSVVRLILVLLETTVEDTTISILWLALSAVNAVAVSEKLWLSQAGVCSTHRSLVRESLPEDHLLPLLSLLQAAESSLLMETPICPAGTQVTPPLPPMHLA